MHNRSALRDAILRIPLTSNDPNLQANSANSLAQSLADDPNEGEERSMRVYATSLEKELLHFFGRNSVIFERRAFYESLQRNNHAQYSYTSLAPSELSQGMLPGYLPPIQSPNSVLSSTSGPHSAIMMISPSSNNQQSPLVSAAPNSVPNPPQSSTPGFEQEQTMFDNGEAKESTLNQQQLQQHQVSSQPVKAFDVATEETF